MTTTYHVLDRTALDMLAGGGGGQAMIAILRSAQLSKHLMLVRYLLEHWTGSDREKDAIIAALDLARARNPDGFANVMGEPLVGAWAAIAARATSRGQVAPADLGHLGAVAMVACAVAGVDGECAVPWRNGRVSVPGLGFAIVPEPGAPRLAAAGGRLFVSTDKAVIEVPSDPEAETPQWVPVRFLHGAAQGRRISLSLDDVDPYRHGHHVPPANRLSGDELSLWRELFVDAWNLVSEQLPERAAELTAGLRTLVPLQATDKRASQSATLRHAFGVFGLTRPDSAADFVVTLIHEFQHSKLSAIIDLTSLSDSTDRRRYFAPWRMDPRPLAGLLQGVYAFVGVADAWRALQAVDRTARLAEQRFAEARLQVDRGLSAVEEADALTEAGKVLVTGLRAAVDKMLAMPVPAAVARAAERTLEETRRRWLQRNDYVGGASMSPSVR